MAIKSTIYKAELEVVDMDRHYYETHQLTLALHPSETEERLMMRILAFALNAHERLAFGKGVSDSEEPDLWLKDLTGDIELWVELGHPDEKILVKALGRSSRVLVYAFSRNPELWWDPIKSRFSMDGKLEVYHVDQRSAKALGSLASRAMNLQCSVQEGEIWMRDDGDGAVKVEISRIK